MAFYVKLNKISDNDSSVRYSFEADPARIGVLALNKATGDSQLVQPMPSDEGLHCYTRAAVKVRREWSEGRLPQTLEWAS